MIHRAESEVVFVMPDPMETALAAELKAFATTIAMKFSTASQR